MTSTIEDWVRACISRAKKRGDLILKLHTKDQPAEFTPVFKNVPSSSLAGIAYRCRVPEFTKAVQRRRPGQTPIDAVRDVFSVLIKEFPECRGLAARDEKGRPFDAFDNDWLVVLGQQSRHLPELQLLDIGGAEIDDHGLKKLVVNGRFPALRVLDLRQTHITDNGLKAFPANAKHLPSLEILYLGGSFRTYDGEVRMGVNDEGLKAVFVSAQHLPQLQSLHLSETKLTDNGLAALVANAKNLKNLRRLDLSDTLVTDEGLRMLCKAAHQFPRLETITNERIGGDISLKELSEYLQTPKLAKSAIAASASKEVLNIERWSQITIALHSTPSRGTAYYVYERPCLPGKLAKLKDGKQLFFPGDQWRKVLELLANSSDGNFARKSDLIRDLRYSHLLDIDRTLSNAMANLARRLREKIESKEESEVPIFESNGEVYRSAFRAIAIIKDDDNQLKFFRVIS